MHADPPVGQGRIYVKMCIEVLPEELKIVLDTMFIALCISLPYKLLPCSLLSP